MSPPLIRNCPCRTHVSFNVILFCNAVDFVVAAIISIMSNLTSILSNLARCANQHILTSLNMVRATALRTESRRAICSSAVRWQQESAEEAPVVPKTSSKEFSIYPPMPGEDSALRWGGMKFEDLPIVHIKATYNNTHIQVTDCSGQYMARTSCGAEGFRNVKKSTPIAAQTAGISVAAKAQVKGVTFVRVVVKGLGPGRLSAIKGLTMGGLEVVSITDNTPVPHNGCRPRKARRM